MRRREISARRCQAAVERAQTSLSRQVCKIVEAETLERTLFLEPHDDAARRFIGLFDLRPCSIAIFDQIEEQTRGLNLRPFRACRFG